MTQPPHRMEEFAALGRQRRRETRPQPTRWAVSLLAAVAVFAVVATLVWRGIRVRWQRGTIPPRGW